MNTIIINNSTITINMTKKKLKHGAALTGREPASAKKTEI